MTDFGDNVTAHSDAQYDTADGSASLGETESLKDAVQDNWVADTRYSLQDKPSALGDVVSNTPTQVKPKARGNPLAAGLIAFGVGLLVSGLIPSSQREREAASTLQEKAEPLKEKATESVKEVVVNLKETAAEAAQSVKETATEAGQFIKDDGASVRQEVQGQLQDSTQIVRQQTQSG
jgi:hypothetical protein